MTAMSAFQLRRPALGTLPRRCHRPPELIALLVLAAVLNLWGLDRNGFANEYYAAAVRSMGSSWHAFLYGSFDAAGRDDGGQAAAGARGSRWRRSRCSATAPGAC